MARAPPSGQTLPAADFVSPTIRRATREGDVERVMPLWLHRVGRRNGYGYLPANSRSKVLEGRDPADPGTGPGHVGRV